jgi:spore coat polysaccharide biosynthesis predicted glycosyltransferase SpsG
MDFNSRIFLKRKERILQPGGLEIVITTGGSYLVNKLKNLTVKVINKLYNKLYIINVRINITITNCL